MRISDWSSDVCSSDLVFRNHDGEKHPAVNHMIEADSEIHAGPVRNIDGAEGANAIGDNRYDQRSGKEDYAARPTLEAHIGNQRCIGRHGDKELRDRTSLGDFTIAGRGGSEKTGTGRR